MVSAPPAVQRSFDQRPTLIDVIGSAILDAGLGALAARVFTSLHIPSITGAIFGATCAMGNALMRHFANREGNEPSLRTAIKIVGFFSSIYLGALVSTALGHPLTFVSALGLHFATLGIIVGGFVVAGALLFSVIVIGRAIADRTNVITAAQTIAQDNHYLRRGNPRLNAFLQNFHF